MTFLAILIVYLLLQSWRDSAVMQQDNWYFNLVSSLKKIDLLANTNGAVLAASVAIPMIAIVLSMVFLLGFWSGFGLLVAVPVLLYSVGRGAFKSHIASYLEALKEEDWDKALQVTKDMGCDCYPDPEVEASGENDWNQLHNQFLVAASYKGFERVFAVFFWFVVLGPIGAILYRLSALFAGQKEALEKNSENLNIEIIPEDEDQITSEHTLAQRWLWILEWPATRVLGISYGFTGNFIGCLAAWRRDAFDTQISSETFLGATVKGALSIEDSETPEELEAKVEERQLRLLQSLLSRTLIFWMCLLAIFTIVAY